MSIEGVLGLAGLLIAQFSLLWYRLGRVEQRLKDHCDIRHPEKEE